MASAKQITCYSVITTPLYSITQILNTEALRNRTRITLIKRILTNFYLIIF